MCRAALAATLSACLSNLALIFSAVVSSTYWRTTSVISSGDAAAFIFFR
jgi:hypothetical protein